MSFPFVCEAGSQTACAVIPVTTHERVIQQRSDERPPEMPA